MPLKFSYVQFWVFHYQFVGLKSLDTVCKQCKIQNNNVNCDFSGFALSFSLSPLFGFWVLALIIKMVKKCCVPGCLSKGTADFFGFPSKAERRDLWFQALGIKESTKTSDFVCGSHFPPGAIDDSGERRRIRPGLCLQSDISMKKLVTANISNF